MPTQKAPKPKRNSKPAKAKKIVVKAEDDVLILSFKCPNCGEAEERVIRCSHCDEAMDFVKQVKKAKDEVAEDVTNGEVVDEKPVAVKPQATEDEDVPTDPYFDEIVENGGLPDIFETDAPSGNKGEGDQEEDEENPAMSLDEISSMLDSDTPVEGASDDKDDDE